MQICFNRRKCPLLRRELPLFQRLLWATGYWVGFQTASRGWAVPRTAIYHVQ
jgi:hypothetical protein